MSITLEKFFEKQIQDYFTSFNSTYYSHAKRLAMIAIKRAEKYQAYVNAASIHNTILSEKSWKKIREKAAELEKKDHQNFLEERIKRIEDEAYTLKKFGYLENYCPDAVRKQAEEFVAKHY